MAAVQEIIPGLDLSLSNRNSDNYCGSIRLKRQKKNLQRELGNAYHPQKCNSAMLAKLRTQRESSVRQNAVVIFSVWFKKNNKKNAKQANILFLLLLVPFFQF